MNLRRSIAAMVTPLQGAVFGLLGLGLINAWQLPGRLPAAEAAARRSDSRGRRSRPRRPVAARVPLSVLVLKEARLWAKPGRQGGYRGTVAAGTRLPIMRQARGAACRTDRWYEVAKGAWMCAERGRELWRLPFGRAQPIVPEGQLIPHRALFARRDGVPVYLRRSDVKRREPDHIVERGFAFSFRAWTRIAGQRFLISRRAEFVPRKQLSKYYPSTFAGRHLPQPPSQGLGWVFADKGSHPRSRPSHRARRLRRLRRHSPVTIFASEGRGRRRYHRIGADRWVRARDVRQAAFTAPPAGIAPRERWVEILTDTQTLVAYEGSRPVYATLVSTGSARHPTPSGLFRVRTKVALSSMNNRPGDAELYRVDDVPWIFYFHAGYAIHGTYWHRRFGRTMSHGCINLAPADARWLFDWAPPQLRPGWTAVETHGRAPGMLVRIRRNRRQAVRYRGPADQHPALVRSAPKH